MFKPQILADLVLRVTNCKDMDLLLKIEQKFNEVLDLEKTWE